MEKQIGDEQLGSSLDAISHQWGDDALEILLQLQQQEQCFSREGDFYRAFITLCPHMNAYC